jgi:hypothetical protein
MGKTVVKVDRRDHRDQRGPLYSHVPHHRAWNLSHQLEPLCFIQGTSDSSHALGGGDRGELSVLLTVVGDDQEKGSW